MYGFKASLLALAVLACAVLPAHADLPEVIFKFGDAPNSEEAHAGWDYSFQGNDWPSMDAAKGWSCGGNTQSPIHVVVKDGGPRVGHRQQVDLSGLGKLVANGTNLYKLNNGHSIQINIVEPTHTIKIHVPDDATQLTDAILLDEDCEKSKVVTAVAAQFHFHHPSEHLLNGANFPIEMHIVTTVSQAQLSSCPATGCIAVVAILFGLSDDLDYDSSFLAPVFNNLPSIEGAKNAFPAGTVLDFNKALPHNRAYATYAGSLTTPPCTEGVLWFVMVEPQTLSRTQLLEFVDAVADVKCAEQADGEPDAATCTKLGSGDDNRVVQYLNGREVKLYIPN